MGTNWTAVGVSVGLLLGADAFAVFTPGPWWLNISCWFIFLVGGVLVSRRIPTFDNE